MKIKDFQALQFLKINYGVLKYNGIYVCGTFVAQTWKRN